MLAIDTKSHLEFPETSEITTDDILWTEKFEKPPFEIDIVITWAGISNIIHQSNIQRTRDNGELKYCLRSIFQYIPWFNHLYLVINNITFYDIMNNKTFINTNKLTTANISLITHSNIYDNKLNIINQTNSNSIESNLHKIKELSNYYIYFNDDFFIGQKLSWKFFYILDRNLNRLIPRTPYISYVAYTFGSNWWNMFRLNSIDSIISPYIDTLPCFNLSKMSKYNISTTIDIPFGNKKSMMRHYVEHMPRPYYKNDWIMFEKQYKKFFNFIESQKKRLINCENKVVSIHKHYLRRWLNGDIKINKMYFKYYDSWYSFRIKYFTNYLMERNYYHYWIFGSNVNRIKQFKYHLNRILTLRPCTFCINDDMPKSYKKYYLFVNELSHFLELYFPEKSAVE